MVKFSFASLNIPSDFIADYNPKHLTLKVGNFPKESSDEILLPDLYADYLIDNSQYKTYDEIVENNIKFEVIDEMGVNLDKTYLVSGIYVTNYELNIKNEYNIYVPYHEYNFLDFFQTKEIYNEFVYDYKNDNSVSDISNTVLSSYDSYLKALGENLSNLIVVMDDGANVEYVHTELRNLFPNLKILSQLEAREGEAKTAFDNLKTNIILITLAIAFVFGLLIIFLNKNFIQRRNKEMATLYSLGYSKSQVFQITILDYALSSTLNYFVVIIIILLLNKTVFKAGLLKVVSDIALNLNMIIATYGLIIVITIFSVLFSILGIRQKKLLKHLR